MGTQQEAVGNGGVGEGGLCRVSRRKESSDAGGLVYLNSGSLQMSNCEMMQISMPRNLTMTGSTRIISTAVLGFVV